jgi:isoleucyl-tRNA synthetase
VFLSEWYDLECVHDREEMGDAFWSLCLAVRQDVNKAMEAARAVGHLRGSLDANVTLYVSSELTALLASLEDELRFVLITSAVDLAPLNEAPEGALEGEVEGLKVVVSASTAEKCERCWHRRDDIGTFADHPTLCGRCVTNIVGDGEIRYYA